MARTSVLVVFGVLVSSTYFVVFFLFGRAGTIIEGPRQYKTKPPFKPFEYAEIPHFSKKRDPAFLNDLTREVMQRAMLWNGTDCKSGLAAPFCRFLQRLDNGQCTSAFAIGGSTSLGVYSYTLWYEELKTWMNKRFPCNGNHTIDIHAVSGSGSISHLGRPHCLSSKIAHRKHAYNRLQVHLSLQTDL